MLNANGTLVAAPGAAYDEDSSLIVPHSMQILHEDATQWSEVDDPVLLVENQQRVAATAFADGKILVSGLRAAQADENGIVPDTFIYDIETNEWSVANKQLSTFKMVDAQGVVMPNGYFYVLGYDQENPHSLLTMKRVKVSDLYESSQDPDAPDPEVPDPDVPNPDTPGSDSPNHNGSNNPESGQSHNDTSANGNDFPQTADPMGNSKIVLVVLALAGAFGLFVASIQKRRVQASIKRKV